MPRIIKTRPANKTQIRVISYNVQSCLGIDKHFSPLRISSVIEKYHADIVCLQELDKNCGRSEHLDQAHVIAQELGMEFDFLGLHRNQPEQFGIATLSPHKMHRIKAGILPLDPDGYEGQQPRGALWEEIDLGGRPVQVLNTHLSVQEKEQGLQVNALLSEAWLRQAMKKGPALLCGDFNAVPAAGHYRRIARILHDTQSHLRDGARKTWPNPKPYRTLDYIFAAYGSHLLNYRKTRTQLEKVASDHLPVITDLEI